MKLVALLALLSVIAVLCFNPQWRHHWHWGTGQNAFRLSLFGYYCSVAAITLAVGSPFLADGYEDRFQLYLLSALALLVVGAIGEYVLHRRRQNAASSATVPPRKGERRRNQEF